MKKAMKQKLSAWVLSFWHRKTVVSYCLAPLAWSFQLISLARYHYFRIKGPVKAKIPVIIVGNISVGGTGKTPLVAHISCHLQKLGFKPVIVMHGYAGKLEKGQTISVLPSSDPVLVGDEALLMAQKCQNIPVVATRKRTNAIAFIESHHPQANIIICDDGLQHYALARDIEIAVIDGYRRFGNGFCLPIGPLRESPKRLKRVNFVVSNGGDIKNTYVMRSELEKAVSLDGAHHTTLNDFVGKTVHAVAGIGHPERFFNILRAHGIKVIAHSFADHHFYEKSDFMFSENHPILMTEKDAVKCTGLNLENAYSVNLTLKIEKEFMENLLRKLYRGQKVARHSGLPNLQTTPPV